MALAKDQGNFMNIKPLTHAEKYAGDLLRKRVQLPDNRWGTIIGAKAGPMMLNEDNIMRTSKRYRIKPDVYGKDFWTQPVLES